MANVIIGNQNIESINDGATMDFVCGTRFPVTQNCTLKTISFYCGNSGPNAILSVYSDINGVADALLTQSSPVAVSAGWTTVSVPSISLTAGQYIWLCWMFDSSITNVIFGTFGGTSETSPLGENPTGFKGASRFQMFNADAVLEKLTCYILPTASDTKATMAIYADDNGVPGALLGVSSERTLTNSLVEWIDFQFNPVALDANTYYWFALLTDKQIYLRCEVTNNGLNNFVFNVNPYSDGFSNPYGAVLGGNQTVASVYATVSSSSNGDGWHYREDGQSFYLWNPFANGLPASTAGMGQYVVATYSIYATAETAIGQWNLISNASSGGTVTPSGTSAYQDGTTVTITATAAEGYHFAHWTVDGVVNPAVTVPTFSILMNSDHTVTATFNADNEPNRSDWWWLLILAAAGGTAIYLKKTKRI